MEKELEEILKDYMTARQIELAIPRVLRLFNVSGQSELLPLAFIKWYSGMEQEKILKAYERWEKESGNSH